MGIELTNWMAELRRVSEVPVPSTLGHPPSDDEVADLVSAFRDAVLRLYNNSLRACGIEVGDAVSESNSVMLYGRVGRELDEDIGAGLVKARKAMLARLEQEEGDLNAEKDRIDEAHRKAVAEAKSLEMVLKEREEKLATIGKQIWKLKELTQ